MKLTFKEYLQSKAALREALQNTPKHSIVYEVQKYCKLPIGDTRRSKEKVSLKPKHQIVVEWTYIKPDVSVATSIHFQNISEIDQTKIFDTHWSNQKLSKWLDTNTIKML